MQRSGSAHRSDAVDGIDRADRVNCLNAGLRRATRVAVTMYEDAMAESGLQGTQFTLLSTISGFGEVTVSALGAYLVMDDSTVTRSVAILRSKNLVEVRPGEDRRTRIIALTHHGRATLDSAYPHWLTAQNQLWARLGDEGATALLALLHTITKEK
ncbi:MAG: MarR family winged helix-turn-helix transcriptional regulator [Phycicoccus sp.]